jgi:single-stranded DNA-binding protein
VPCDCRTLVYLEGDATMRTYDGADGKKQSSLSLVQTKIEVLKRPAPAEAQNTEAPPAGH